MGLYVIGDLHLSFSEDKPMDIFGKKWTNHIDKLREGFSSLTDSDVTVICGDISWSMGIDGSLEDFRFIDSLPGKKIILKGNHDYWWSTMSKMNKRLRENDINSISFLHNNSYLYEDISICGTRGWNEDELDSAILPREIGRLEASLDSAISDEIYLFCHYPPCREFRETIKKRTIRKCFYGHVHGESIKISYNGWIDGCEYRLISADALNFKPLNIH